MRALGALAWGGDRKMFFMFLIVTYSSKRKTMRVFWRGTLTVPGRGSMPMMSGGMVSLSPPVGDCVVFAQECTNSIGMKMSAATISGRYLFIIIRM